MRRPLLAFGLSAFLLGANAVGSGQDKGFQDLHHTTWLARDGAPSQICALAQTTDGYLWIGSSRGLFRFDGVQFERYAPAGIPAHNIYALQAMRDGGLWISYRPSGLAHLKDGRLRVFTRPEEVPRTEVFALAQDSDGRLWAGTHYGLALLEGTRWREIGLDWGFVPKRTTCMFIDREGTLWIASGGRMYSFRRGARKFETVGSFGYVTGMSQSSDGRIWIVEDGKVRPLAHEGGIRPDLPPAEAMTIDRQDNLWILLADGGVRRLPAADWATGALESSREREGLSGLVKVTLEDREGNLWFGTTRGLDRFRASQLVPVGLPAGYFNLTLFAGDNAEVWVASAEDRPLLRVRGDEPARAVSAGRSTSSVYRDRRGVVWWGGRGGLWRQQGDRFDYFPQPRDAPQEEWLWEIFGGDEEGRLLIGLGDTGVFRFRSGVWTRQRPVGLLERTPSASFADSEGRTWLGYTENRVALLDGGQVRSFSRQDGLEIGRIRVIRGRGARLWFGGELGLALFQDGRFRTIRVAGREPLGTVSGMVETADGALWLNEMNGIVHIPPEEVRRVSADPDYAVSVRTFDFLDGLPGAGQMNYTCSTAIESSDGRLWFATDTGLARIDPARLSRNLVPPPVSIRSVQADGHVYDVWAPVRLPSGTSGLRIEYTALSLSIPERVRFRYRLEGVDDDWRDAGTRRVAFYTNPPPGNYRFRVVASNNDGIWNETGATVGLSIAPAFYQTTWFLLLCVASVGALAWIAYRLRLRQVSRRLDLQFNERLAERTRIAQELHDTLLQGVLSASMQLHVAADQVPPESAARPHLTRVLELMGIVINEGRNAVRGLRTPVQLDSLEEALSRVRSEFNNPESIEFQVVSEGEVRPLNGVIRDEVYRISREALANAFLHSGGTRIEVEVEYTSTTLRVLVRDDGRGIGRAVLEAGREGHWGLQVMRERAERAGAKLRVLSRPGSGTEVEVTVPGTIAFRNEPQQPGKKRWWLARMNGPSVPTDQKRTG